jgi:hypothetical protein
MFEMITATQSRRNMCLAFLVSFLLPMTATAQETTTTITTTTTNADGTTTTTEETTSTQETTAAQETTISGVKLVGPTGVTGTIRRSDRRQDRRQGVNQ